MKTAFSIFMLACSISMAQTSEIGVTNSGINIGDPLINDKNLGLYANWQYGQGMILKGTNIVAWADVAGNNFVARQGISTNYPAVSVIGTNLLGNPMPCVSFSTAAGLGFECLRCDPVVTPFSGLQKQFTIIMVIDSKVASSGNAAFTFGNTGATNITAARIGIRPNSTTPTDFLVYHNSNTNNIGTQFSVSLSASTNVWCIKGSTFDGNIITSFNNLSPSGTLDVTGQGLTTLNTCTIGGLIHSNGSTQPWSGGMLEILVYTNALSGQNYTNVVNRLNSNYNLF